MKQILSLGMGVQSSVIALMSAHGELPKLDLAIFSDPGWEGSATMKWAAWLTGYCAENGIRVVTVKKDGPGIRADALQAKRFATMPFYSMMDGKPGMVMRQCTMEYKIQPVQKEIRRFLGVEPRHKVREQVNLWMGISLDEVQRMKESRLAWITHSWPLIDRRMDRGDCLRWLDANGLPRPPKSACIGCPFKSDASWMAMKRDNPIEFADAVDFDAKIRKARKNMRSDMFLHRSCKPLSEVNFGEDQIDAFINECEGACGV